MTDPSSQVCIAGGGGGGGATAAGGGGGKAAAVAPKLKMRLTSALCDRNLPSLAKVDSDVDPPAPVNDAAVSKSSLRVRK